MRTTASAAAVADGCAFQTELERDFDVIVRWRIRRERQPRAPVASAPGAPNRASAPLASTPAGNAPRAGFRFPRLLAFAETTMKQYDEHMHAFQAMTKALGGTEQDEPQPAVRARRGAGEGRA